MIDYGQIDEARTRLEDEILDNPLQTDAVNELLDIYKHTRDREAFRSMRERLDKRRLLLNDGQRRRLAFKGKAFGRKALREQATQASA